MSKKKIKRIKKDPNDYPSMEFPPAFYPNGGYLAGNLGVSGIQNDQLNLAHKYINPGVAGFAQGLASAVGLGGVTQAVTDQFDPYGQLKKNKDYKTAAAITGGVASLGMNAANMGASLGKKKSGDAGSLASADPDQLPDQEFSDINTNIPQDQYTTPMNNPGDQYTEIDNLQSNSYNAWNSMGGKLKKINRSFYPNGGELDPNKPVVAYQGKPQTTYLRQAIDWLGDAGLQDFSNSLQQPYSNAMEAKPIENSALQKYYNRPRTSGYNTSLPLDNKMYAGGGYMEIPSKKQKNPYLAFGGEWVPPATDDQGGTTINGVYYSAQDLDLLNRYEKAGNSPIFTDENAFKTAYNPVGRMDQGLRDAQTWELDPLNFKPWTTLVDPVVDDKGNILQGDKSKAHRNQNFAEGQDNTYSKKRKFNAMGGMLSEANGGFTHEDPNMQNINSGIPIGQESVIEQGETVYTPENYVFSDRIKVPGKKTTFAKASKSIKNKFSLRPEDKLSKSAMEDELNTLMQSQEAIKQAKASKLMNKALELNPNMMGMGGKFYDDGGELEDEDEVEMSMGQFNKEHKRLLNVLKTGNKAQRLEEYGRQVKEMEEYKAFGGKMYYPNGGPIESLFVGPQLHKQPPYITPGDITNPDEIIGNTANNYPDPFINYRPTNNYTPTTQGDYTQNVSNSNQSVYNPNTNNTRVDSGPITPDEQLDKYYAEQSRTKMPFNSLPVKAGMFGTQAMAEALRIGLTPNSPLVGNLNYERLNPYTQQAIAQQQANQALASSREGIRNSGVGQAGYLANLTMGMGNQGANLGSSIANIRNQADKTNLQIGMQEANMNKQLEAMRNETITQDLSNRSNQLGAVGSLVQNTSKMLTDNDLRNMDMFTLPLLSKQNYKIKIDPETGELVTYYENTPKLKKIGKYGGRLGKC